MLWALPRWPGLAVASSLHTWIHLFSAFIFSGSCLRGVTSIKVLQQPQKQWGDPTQIWSWPSWPYARSCLKQSCLSVLLHTCTLVHRCVYVTGTLPRVFLLNGGQNDLTTSLTWLPPAASTPLVYSPQYKDSRWNYSPQYLGRWNYSPQFSPKKFHSPLTFSASTFLIAHCCNREGSQWGRQQQ